MNAPYSISVTHRAAAEIRQLASWWQQHRLAAPDAVQLELERAFTLLSMLPKVGAIAKNARLANVRRVHLAKIHHHLYYRIAGNRVEILALWHTSRHSKPGI
ncbi:type II toxin-antitoxin system RelE/ParE family toxin [Duganella sp. Leaf61]|uniref:type II toxin-antitoxin system RelE/ParE family toxin n=1 Tax=Duganella sp. Leaf61 TaxID=1736227 RepID=UPI0009EA07D9